MNKNKGFISILLGIVMVLITVGTGFYVANKSANVGETVNPLPVRNFLGLTDSPNSYTGQALKVVRVNAGENALEFATGGGGGGGDALTTDPLSQFASTTSSQLAGVISDETGSGKLVFATDPRLETATGLRITSTGGTPNALVLFNVGGKAIELDNSLITVDRNQKFPDASGTFPVGTGTSNEIAYWSGTNTLSSLTTATYPSLTELSYVKGATSSLQTQINTKAPSTSPTFATSITGSYLTASQILGTDGSKNIVSLATATYPSLTELAYVKGVTSAIQTQLDARVLDTGDTITGTYNITGQLNLDNLRLDGNTLSSTDTNGNINLTPNGTGIVLVPDGSTTVAGIAFTGGTGVGFSRSSTANTGLIMSGGADRFSWNTTTFAGTSSNSALILRGTGSDSTPSFSQISDTNTGVVLPGTDVLGLTTGGVRALTINASQQVSIPKGVTPRVVTTTDDSTAVIDVTVTDVYELSAVANNTTFSFTGTAVDGQKILIRYKDAGVSKTLTWTGFTAIGVTLPTATTVSKWGYVGVQYNSAAGAWHAIAVTTQT